MAQHQLFGYAHEIVGTVELSGAPPSVLRLVGYGAPRFFVLENGVYLEKSICDVKLVPPAPFVDNEQWRLG